MSTTCHLPETIFSQWYYMPSPREGPPKNRVQLMTAWTVVEKYLKSHPPYEHARARAHAPARTREHTCWHLVVVDHRVVADSWFSLPFGRLRARGRSPRLSFGRSVLESPTCGGGSSRGSGQLVFPTFRAAVGEGAIATPQFRPLSIGIPYLRWWAIDGTLQLGRRRSH